MCQEEEMTKRTWTVAIEVSIWLRVWSFFFMLVNMAERGGGVTDMACGLLIRRSSCCHCSKKKKCNKVSRGKNQERGSDIRGRTGGGGKKSRCSRAGWAGKSNRNSVKELTRWKISWGREWLINFLDHGYAVFKQQFWRHFLVKVKVSYTIPRK